MLLSASINNKMKCFLATVWFVWFEKLQIDVFTVLIDVYKKKNIN